MSPSDDRRIETAQVRRSPRYTVFLLAGAFVGILVGVAVGGVVALVLDRSLARRAHEVRVEREVITIDDAE